MRGLFALLLMSLSMTLHAGNFFPPDYKTFPFKEGDLLASQRADGKFSVNKVLKIDRVALKKGESINIQGQSFPATEDDFLLVIGCSYGAAEFKTIDEARAAAASGKWTVQLGHAPNRAPGAAAGQTRIGNAAVTESELTGYREWRAAFDKGQAGVF
jgi:hypothetical protein